MISKKYNRNIKKYMSKKKYLTYDNGINNNVNYIYVHNNNMNNNNNINNNMNNNNNNKINNNNNNDNNIYLNCPTCGIQIYIEEINCGIFKCGILKSNFNQINPHMSKAECMNLVKNNLIYGCGSSFKIINNNNKYYLELCSYDL
jgi:hypothetical protein